MADLSGPVQDGLAQQEQTGATQDDGLTPSTFVSYCRDIQYQPSWRNEADKCVDYYDGNQIDGPTMDALLKKGMGPLIMNIIAPLVNVVLGMEAKTRSDWRVTADSDEWQDVAEALSSKLFEAERETRADRGCADAYAGQIKAGLGWVEVSRNANPFEYPYRASFVHRREMFWDWRDQTHDLKKSVYQVRKRWYDVDQAQAYFPKHRELLEAAMGDQFRTYLLTRHVGLELSNSFDQDRGLDLEDFEDWRSIERKRVCLYEVWYRRITRGYVLRLPNNDVVELNMKNRLHVALLGRGLVKPEAAVYTKMRMSIWAGPIKLCDCPVQKDHSPYVPFWGYREDRTGVPYGLIRAMISPQDEVNARRQKMLWFLGSRRIEMDADALDTEANTVDTVQQEIGRADAITVLNPNRINKQGAFTVHSNLDLSDAQFKIMAASEEAAQKVVGVFNSMLGRESGTTSGIAINSLVEQGTTALAEINDNFRFGRRLVGERLLDEVREDLIGQAVTVMAGEAGKRKTISLNQRAVHPSGMEILMNDVRGAKVKVALEDVQSSPAYRQQQFTMLAELTKGLPPQLQAAIAPFVMEASELQKRREMADAIRKAMGIMEPRTPEEEQAMAKKQAEDAAMQRQAIVLDLQEREAKVNKLRAEAEKIRAEAVSGGMDDQEHAAFEADLQRVRDEGERLINDLTAQLMTERAQGKLREQAYKNKMASDANISKEKDAAASQEQDKLAQLQEQMDAVVQTVTDEIAKLGVKAKAKQKKAA